MIVQDRPFGDFGLAPVADEMVSGGAGTGAGAGSEVAVGAGTASTDAIPSATAGELKLYVYDNGVRPFGFGGFSSSNLGMWLAGALVLSALIMRSGRK